MKQQQRETDTVVLGPAYQEARSATAALVSRLERSLAETEATALVEAWDGDRIRLIRDRTSPGRWGLAWRLRCRSEGGRRALEAALQRCLPARLARLSPDGAGLDLAWISDGRTLEVRASWPHAAASPPG